MNELFWIVLTIVVATTGYLSLAYIARRRGIYDDAVIDLGNVDGEAYRLTIKKRIGKVQYQDTINGQWKREAGWMSELVFNAYIEGRKKW